MGENSKDNLKFEQLIKNKQLNRIGHKADLKEGKIDEKARIHVS